MVSVPLRGYGFEITNNSIYHRSIANTFPSPYGDMVLKLGGFTMNKKNVSEFPSPYGDMVLKSLRWDALPCLAQYAVLRRGCIFPPFCGDAAF